MMRKAVILAAGSAARMQPRLEEFVEDSEELAVIRTGQKMATSFSKYPFLDYQMLNLVDAEIEQVNLVLKPTDAFFRERYRTLGSKLFPELAISYSFQEVTDGTAHAVLAARDFVGDDPAVIINGDNDYPPQDLEMLHSTPLGECAMVGYDKEGFVGYVKEQIGRFAVVVTRDGYLISVTEKPERPEDQTVTDELFGPGDGRVSVKGRCVTSMNAWYFTPDIMQACAEVPRHEPRRPGKPGEFELTDAVALLMERGRKVRVYYNSYAMLDLTRSSDIEFVGNQIRKRLRDRVEALDRRSM